MDTKKNTTAAPGRASRGSMASLSDHIEAQGGILAQTDAVQHMSVMLNEALQRKLCGPLRDKSESIYVQAQFSAGEIDRIIWLAGEIQERGQKLSEQMDALYDDLTDLASVAIGKAGA